MDQLNIFQELNKPFKIDKPIRLIELFAGVGSQAMALRDINANFEHYKVVEFDKYAITSYNAIHGTDFPTMDITKINANDLEIVDKNEFCYIVTYSFPCQSLSKAGKGEGMKKGSGTRSGLLWEVERLLDECKKLPQVILMENVPDVIGTKNINDFNDWQLKLEKLGYSNYVECLNAKYFGIPQNRNRCFMVSILGNYYYEFPKKIPLKLRLKDILESNVDEKHYLSNNRIIGMTETNFNSYSLESSVIEKEGIAKTILARFEGNPQCVSENKKKLCDKLLESGKLKEYDMIRHSYANDRMNNENIIIENSGCISSTITTRPDTLGIAIKEKTKKGYAIAKDGDGVYLDRPHQKRGVVQKKMIQTLKTSGNDIGVVCDNLRIRKLTPKECWRLMGFDDVDFEKALKVNSNSQLYKQAGNSIVKQVLMAIFKQMI